jgi:hypothetical protein
MNYEDRGYDPISGRFYIFGISGHIILFTVYYINPLERERVCSLWSLLVFLRLFPLREFLLCSGILYLWKNRQGTEGNIPRAIKQPPPPRCCHGPGPGSAGVTAKPSFAWEPFLCLIPSRAKYPLLPEAPPSWSLFPTPCCLADPSPHAPLV